MTFTRSDDWAYLAGLVRTSPALLEKLNAAFFEIRDAGGGRFGGFLLIGRPWGVEFHVELAPEVRGAVGLSLARKFLELTTKGRLVTSLIDRANRPARFFAAALGFVWIASELETSWLHYARHEQRN